MLPNIRPNTEDFLTFLCFRNSSVLPSHLDYLNTNKRTETATTSTATTTTTTTDCSDGSSDAKPLEIITKKEYISDDTKLTGIKIKNEKKIQDDDDDVESNAIVKSQKQQNDEDKSSFIPFAVRKNAEKVSFGKRRQTVQALKKKYQEQRLAKTKVKQMNRISSSGGGRQTRSSKLLDDNLDDEEEMEKIEELIKFVDDKIKKKPITTKSSKTNENAEKLLKKNSIKKTVEPEPQPPPPTKRQTRQTINNLSLDIEMPSKSEAVVIPSRNSGEKVINEFPADLSMIKKSPLQKGKRGKMKKSATQQQTIIAVEPQQNSRSTRQHPISNLNNVIDKKKVSPPPPPPLKTNRKQSLKKTESPVKLSEADFSSEDDEPLAKTIKKPETSKNVAKELIKVKPQQRDTIDKMDKLIDEPPATKKTKSNAQTAAPPPPLKTSPTISNLEKKELPTKTTSIATVPSIEKQNFQTPVAQQQSLSTPTSVPEVKSAEPLEISSNVLSTTTVKRRKRKNEIASLDHHIDTSPNTAAAPTSSRPMRKTKTAAAIYMELIGQKLNLDDFDDDNNSMDSFPELPNVRKTEQMENELKANIGKEKPKAKRATKPKATTTLNVNKIDDKQLTIQNEKSSAIVTSTYVSPVLSSTSNTTTTRPKKISQKDENLARVDTAESLVMLAQGLVSPKKIDTTTLTIPVNKQMMIPTNIATMSVSNIDSVAPAVVIPTSSSNKLEKSFSDSDDEPLMTKLSKKNAKTKVNLRKKKDTNTDTTTLPKPPEMLQKQPTTVPAVSAANVFSSHQQNTFTIPSSSSSSAAAIMLNNCETILTTKQAHQKLVDMKKIDNDSTKLLSQTISTTKSMMMQQPVSSSFTNKNTTTTTATATASTLQLQPLYSQIPLTGTGSKEETPKNIATIFGASYNTTSTPAQQQSSAAAMKMTPPPSPAAAAAVIAATTTTPTTGNSTQQCTQQQAISAILANLMPSKEESGKIFGIASVTLAQSSGPNDTKCTLGKCGSIHKPSLGPVVPTEIFSLSDQMSSKERRKAKVNMTHEQIQKWLTECAPSTEYPVEDFLDDDLSTPPKPATYPVVQSRETAESNSFATRSPKTKPPIVQQPVIRDSRPSTVSSRGPSLKAKAVVLKDTKSDAVFDSILINTTPTPTQPIEKIKKFATTTTTTASSSIKPVSTKEITTEASSSSLPANIIPHVKPVIVEKVKDEKLATVALPPPQPSPVVKPSPPAKKERITKANAKILAAALKKSPHSKTPPKSSSTSALQPPTISSPQAASVNTFSTAAKFAQTTVAPSSSPTLVDKKPIYNQRRTPVYNTKLSESPQKHTKPVVNSFGAFSPENEPSIYSFDKEEDIIPASTPFRRHSRRESNSSRMDSNQDGIGDVAAVAAGSSSEKKSATKRNASNAETTGNESIADNISNQTTPNKTPKQQAVSLTLSPEDNSKSASIGVDVSTLPKPSTSVDKLLMSIDGGGAGGGVSGGNGGNNGSGAGGGNDSDSDGHTFYIPLQSSNVTGGSKSDQLIQGVAVKLGTEGPEGPNQRVIMHAKLVTKAQMGTNTTPIPESMANVHEIVKSLIASKDSNVTSSKSVPIGTVQPRFKSSAVAKTSTTVAQQQQQQPPETRPQTSGKQSRVKTSTVTSPTSATASTSVTTTAAAAVAATTIQPSNNAAFPCVGEPAQMVEALIFRPTEKEFQDPIEFIERITPIAARFGLCRIIPPASFKPECNISDDMRFSATNQYVHKMLHRWGPSAKEFSAIRKYLATQSITLTHPPWIGGMEVDLPRLYHTVQELGGLKEVIEKKKWPRVSEEMCIPKLAQDRVTKLDDIYCKYLLPYDTLSPAERQKLFDEVEADWAKTEAKARRNADRSALSDDNDDEDDDDDSEDDDDDDGDNFSMECVVKGRSMALSAFFRIARNTMALWFKNTEPTSMDIESEYWRHVAVRDSHVCVHAGSIDSSGRGYGFPTPGTKGKAAAGAKHPWNLKVLTNNQGSILRSIGACPGVTVPTLHVGMLFSAVCWYRDPHGLPWIEYLHTGGSKIWYGVPDEQSSNFRTAFTSLVPTHCQNKTVWLPCETAMVPPHMLTDRGVSLCRTEQEPGQFVVVFPRAYTSSLCTGYAISESVYFATSSWLDTARDDFMVCKQNGGCENKIIIFNLFLQIYRICIIAVNQHYFHWNNYYFRLQPMYEQKLKHYQLFYQCLPKFMIVK